MRRWTRLLIPALLLAAAMPVRAAWLRDVPVTLHQPDGTPLSCFVSGDEFFHWAHDARGYVITRDPADGRLVYAAANHGRWVPTAWTAGIVDPAAKGLDPDLPLPLDEVRGRHDLFRSHEAKNRPVEHGGAKVGQFNNIVIFVRFADQADFTEQTSFYNSLFNSTVTGYNSMANYYQEVSYGQLAVSSTFYPPSTTTVLSYQDAHARAYYSPRSFSNPAGYDTTNSGIDGARRLHGMLVNAVNSIAGDVPPSLNIDRDNDTYVDNVCFIVKGPTDTWNDMLWPHMWQLMQGYTASINGKTVSTYDLQLEEFLNQAAIGNGVLCHEMFHSLGAPDLYRYVTGAGTFSPVGPWDLMEDNGNPPQHMLTYMKSLYGGWLPSPPVISTSGTYTLQPVTSPTNNCYRINSPNSSTEYYVVEYRKQSSSGFEAGLPGSGLIVYRINTTAAARGDGNAFGPPDEVYVYRPGGSNTVTGTVASANFGAGVGRTSITDATSPSGFLSDDRPGGLSITSIGGAGSTISFTVTTAGAPTCATRAGDANGDNQVTVTDLVATVNDILQTQALSPGARACVDMNADGSVNVLDLLAIVDVILHPGAAGPAVTTMVNPSAGSLPVRAELVGGAWRLAFDGNLVAGVQVELPCRVTPTSGPRLEGGTMTTAVDWDVREGTLRLVAYEPNGGAIAPGACTLILPGGAGGSGPTGGTSADQDLVPDGASLRFSTTSLLFAGRDGLPLPVVLSGAGAASARALGPRITTVIPNPSRGAVRLRVEGLQPGAPPRITACDVAGRIVARFSGPAAGGDGTSVVAWDEHGQRGVPLPTGCYFLVPEAGPAAESVRLFILR